MRHTLRAGFVVMMVVAAGAVVSARVPARAVQGLEAGYWWQAQPDGAPLPPPGNVPDKGLWVSGSDADQVAISAVRFQLGNGETAPVLTLKVHSQNPPNQVNSATSVAPVVIACPTNSAWVATSAGPWNARPKADCTGGVHGTPSSDGSTISFDLAVLAADGSVDVVFVPGPGAAAVPAQPPAVPGVSAPSQPSGFDLTFEPVGIDQVHISPGAAETAPAAGGDSSPPASDVGTSPADVTSSAGSVPDFNFAATAVQPSTGTAAGSVPSVAPGSLTPQLRQADAASLKENHGYRALAVILLAVLLWWAWRQAVPPKSGKRTIYDGPPVTA